MVTNLRYIACCNYLNNCCRKVRLFKTLTIFIDCSIMADLVQYKYSKLDEYMNHSCEWFIYSHDRFAYSAAGKYVDRSWEYINRLSDTWMWNWVWGSTIPFLGTHQWDFRCSVSPMAASLLLIHPPKITISRNKLLPFWPKLGPYRRRG